MKRNITLLLLLGISLFSFAQSDSTYLEASIRYEKNHFYYHKGDEMNVIDMDLEWPETVDYQNVKPLRQFLCKTMFNLDCDNLDEATDLFLKRFGEPVSEQLKNIPDDNKYCYVDCKLYQVGHKKDRFISYRLSYICSPSKASSQKGDTLNILFTYDINKGEILRLNDLLRISRITNNVEYASSFAILMMNNAIQPVPETFSSMQIRELCLADSCLVIDATGSCDDGFFDYTSLPSYADSRALISKEGRRLMEDNITIKPKQATALQNMKDGHPIYTSDVTMPQLQEGRQKLLVHLSSINVSGLSGKGDVDMRTSFIVDDCGYLSGIRIVKQVSPEIDREVANSIRLINNISPGQKDGKNVFTRVTLPILFQLH